MIGARMIYPVLLPALSAEFDLTLTIAGLLVTIVRLGYAIGQVPGGVLADRHGARRPLMASVTVVAAGLLAVALAPTAVALFLSTGLVGVGQSLYPVARITTFSELYPDRIGRALGLTMATGDLGRTVLPPIAGVLTAAIAWRAGVGSVLPPFSCWSWSCSGVLSRTTPGQRVRGRASRSSGSGRYSRHYASGPSFC